MKLMTTRRIVWALLAVSIVSFGGVSSDSQASEPKWDHGSSPLVNREKRSRTLRFYERPYRPLHFYGNTVRRMHYRGTPLPVPKALAPNTRKSQTNES